MNQHLIDRLAEEWAQLDPTDPLRGLISDAIAEINKQPAQQEPVAWANPNDLQNFDMKVRTNGGPLHTMPLYTSPQPAQWQKVECPICGDMAIATDIPPAQRKPLTLGQKQRLWSGVGDKPTLKDRVNAYGLAIEAAHGIKENT